MKMIRDYMAQFLVENISVYQTYFILGIIQYPVFFPPVKLQMSEHSYIVIVTVKFSDFQKGVTGSFKTWSRGWWTREPIINI